MRERQEAEKNRRSSTLLFSIFLPSTFKDGSPRPTRPDRSGFLFLRGRERLLRLILGGVLALVPFFLVPCLRAEMMGSPAPQGRTGFSGYSIEYDATDLKLDSANSRYGGTLQNHWVLFRTDYGLLKRADLFLLLGTADVQSALRSFSSGSGFAFGAGARVKLVQWGDLQLGTGFHVVQLFSRDSSATAPKLSFSRFGADLGGVLVGLPAFRPYAGFQLAETQGRFWGGQESARVTTRNWLGLIFGGEFRLPKGFWLGIEGKLINEYSAGVRLTFRP